MMNYHKTSQAPSFADAVANMAAAGQVQGLSALLAEMQALGALLPGVADLSDTDEEIDGGFDNMPV